MSTERIMLHGPYPDMPTGYANQLRWILRRMAKRYGTENVALSCTAGIVRHNTTWEGIKVYGRSPYTDMAEDLVRYHHEDFGADLIITLCCPWKLHGQVWKDMRTIHLMPVDRTPIGRPDYYLLQEGGGMPAAVSRFGEQVMRKAGLEPLYLPHAVDTSVFRPAADRARLRKAAGVDHLFMVGMNAANTDQGDRKQFYESFAGFGEFHAKHPLSALAVHSAMVVPDGLDLMAIAEDEGFAGSVVFSNMYQLASSGAPDDALAAWYATLDVYLGLGNEGYGIPAAEAAACGTPVILGNYSTGPELVGPGWLVQGQRRWNLGHAARWHVPFIESVAEQLEAALEGARDRRHATREFAVANLDVNDAWEKHWLPVLETL